MIRPGGDDTRGGTRHNRRGLARASASLSSSSSLGRLLSPFTTISPLQTCRGRGEALDALWFPLVPGKFKRGGGGGLGGFRSGRDRVEDWDSGVTVVGVRAPPLGSGLGWPPRTPRGAAMSLGYPRRCGRGPHSAEGAAAPLNVARRTLLVHVRAGASLRPARVQAHDAYVPCGYAGGKPRINFGGGGVGFGSRGPRRADF